MNRWLLAAAGMLTVVSVGIAQDAPGAANREAMKKLSFLAGKWAGEAKVQTPKGEAKLVKQTEDIQFKLGGVVLVIEGLGRGKLADSDKEGVVFNAFATIGYDAEAKKYHMRAHVMEGHYVDPEITLKDSGLVWQFTPPKSKVQIRYTINIADDTWNEIGEVSYDGKMWTRFIDMTLKRVKE